MNQKIYKNSDKTATRVDIKTDIILMPNNFMMNIETCHLTLCIDYKLKCAVERKLINSMETHTKKKEEEPTVELLKL